MSRGFDNNNRHSLHGFNPATSYFKQLAAALKCPRCDGLGFEDHQLTEECGECNGTGFATPTKDQP